MSIVDLVEDGLTFVFKFVVEQSTPGIDVILLQKQRQQRLKKCKLDALKVVLIKLTSNKGSNAKTTKGTQDLVSLSSPNEEQKE